jgi:hypothetical protein
LISRIYGINGPVITALEIVDDNITAFTRVGCSANDNNTLRFEKKVHIHSPNPGEPELKFVVL